MKVREAKNSLDLFNLLSKNKLIYVELKSEFISHIRKLVLNKYKTFKNFNKIFLKISYPVVKHEFKKARYHSFVRWIKTIESFKINRQDFFGNIVGFRINGSHKKGPIFLKRDIIIDEKFVEGYALYIAEGDTGLSGKKVPKKLRFTNSNLEVVNFFVDWVNTYFPNNFFYLDVIFPSGLYPENNFSELIAKKLSLDIGRIKIRHDRYNKKIKYRVCLGSAIIIGLVLSMDKLIKKLSEKNKSLAVGYIRGIMAGEGTIYFNKSRYVRVEMKNKKEIEYVCCLLKKLKYKCEILFRKKRPGMFSIFIGAKQLKKFYNEIGFGQQNERNDILKLAALKQLRINQYV